MSGFMKEVEGGRQNSGMELAKGQASHVPRVTASRWAPTAGPAIRRKLTFRRQRSDGKMETEGMQGNVMWDHKPRNEDNVYWVAQSQMRLK